MDSAETTRVELARIACALGPERRALVLGPDGPSGWFGGRSFVAADPIEVADRCLPARAFDMISAAFDATSPVLVAAVLPYEGPATVHVYAGAWVVSTGDRAGWGSPPLFDDEVVAAHPVCEPIMHSVYAEMDERSYTEAVSQVHEAIRAGDVYVLNLTYRVRGTSCASPGEAYLALNAKAPAPMSALFAHPTAAFASVSPERFVSADRIGDGTIAVTVEPIKGTAARGDDPEADAESARLLSANEKERAEHVMIVDLERNDLGRVCEPGSVTVDPLLSVFATPYCHQMASVVHGRLGPDAGIRELLESAFPCGSVTGAPKRAAMEHIGRFELSPRGAYTGSLVIATPGRIDSSVLIRTLEYEGDTVVWGTGGGITIDSDPSAEYRESVLKTWPVLGQ